MRLVIANKLYSSWSLRPWLVLKAFDIAFDETVIPLRQPDTEARIRAHSPTGKVPVLIDGEASVWESTAIMNYLAARFPEKPIWPRERMALAQALSIVAEMHASFEVLRRSCPMNLGKRFATPQMSDALKADVARIETIWRETRQRFGGPNGPYLFGAFTAADAMFAPVVTRFDAYSLPVAADTRAYMGAIMAHPAFVAWRHDAYREPWRIPDYEAGHTMTELLAPPPVI